jgi:hypothetical protein
MNTISGTTAANVSILYFGTAFGMVEADEVGNYAILINDGGERFGLPSDGRIDDNRKWV